MRRGWLTLLALYLTVWVPLNFAVEAGHALPSVGYRGPWAVVELITHAIGAALAVAAGRALWIAGDDAIGLAAAAVLLSTAIGIQSVYLTRLPRQTAPGQHLPIAAVHAAHGAVWLLYLRRRARSSR